MIWKPTMLLGFMKYIITVREAKICVALFSFQNTFKYLLELYPQGCDVYVTSSSATKWKKIVLPIVCYFIKYLRKCTHGTGHLAVKWKGYMKMKIIIKSLKYIKGTRGKAEVTFWN